MISVPRHGTDDNSIEPWSLFVVEPRSHLRTRASAPASLSLSVSDRVLPFAVVGQSSHLGRYIHDGEVKRGHLHVTADGADGSAVSGTVIFATPTKSGAASFSHDPGNRTLLLNTIRSAKPLPLYGRHSCSLSLMSDFSP